MAQTNVRWFFNFSKWTPTYHELLLATSCIQPEEKVRLSKFVFQKDFKSSLIGLLLMRKFVSQVLAKPYNDITFVRNNKGRPVVESNDSVSFNVSHQGDYTVLAGHFSSLLLGVDVMKLEYSGGKPVSEFFRIMNRNFSTPEWKQIYSFSNEKDQVKTFCRLWALKESYVKATSIGITIKLNEVSFRINSPLNTFNVVTDTELFYKDKKLHNWHFQEMLIDDDHCVAVASDSEIETVVFQEISFNDLMKDAKPLLESDERYCLEYFKKENKPC